PVCYPEGRSQRPSVWHARHLRRGRRHGMVRPLGDYARQAAAGRAGISPVGSRSRTSTAATFPVSTANQALFSLPVGSWNERATGEHDLPQAFFLPADSAPCVPSKYLKLRIGSLSIPISHPKIRPNLSRWYIRIHPQLINCKKSYPVFLTLPA